MKTGDLRQGLRFFLLSGAVFGCYRLPVP